MEFFIVMISVPLFLVILLLFSLFVLPHYPRRESVVPNAPPVENTTSVQRASSERNVPGTLTKPATIVGWGLTLAMYAIFLVATIVRSRRTRRNES
jgi:hypothetical protein